VTVTVTCANENASVTAGGSGKAPKVRSAVPSKAKRFTLAPITAQVAANQVTTLALEVPKKGRKALKRAAKAGKKGKVVVTMTATDDLGQVSEDQQKLKFRAKPKKVGRG
jgi:Rieske Fe-S protein